MEHATKKQIIISNTYETT